MQILVYQSVASRKSQLKKLINDTERLAYRCETVIRKNIWELGSEVLFFTLTQMPLGGICLE